MNDTLGWVGTGLALTLNIFMSQEINQLLTIIVSGLSIVYLFYKIDEKRSERKTRVAREAMLRSVEKSVRLKTEQQEEQRLFEKIKDGKIYEH